jgi:hypothetical protein
MKKLLVLFLLLVLFGCSNPVDPVLSTIQLEYKVLAPAVSDGGSLIILADFGNGSVEQQIDSVVYHDYIAAIGDLTKDVNFYMVYWTFDVNDITGNSAQFQICQVMSPGNYLRLGIVTYDKP